MLFVDQLLVPRTLPVKDPVKLAVILLGNTYDDGAYEADRAYEALTTEPSKSDAVAAYEALTTEPNNKEAVTALLLQLAVPKKPTPVALAV